MSFSEDLSARRLVDLSPANWDRVIRTLDARFRVLEEQLGIERQVTDGILARGLQVIEDQLAPTVAEAQARADEITLAARDLGLMFRASSASSLVIGEGAKTFILAEGERNRFAAPLFVIAAVAGQPDKWMAGQVTGWNVDTGALAIAVTNKRGAGTFAAWDVSIAGVPPDGPAGQSIDDIPGLRDELDAKADAAATTTALAGKAAASHGHAFGDVTGLQAAIDAKADAAATTTALAGKAAASHGHVVADVTGLQAAIDAKADGAATTAALAGKAALAVEGQQLSGGASVVSKDLGAPAAGATLTPSPANRPLQHVSRNASWTLAAPAVDGSYVLLVTNTDASAKTTTFSGFAGGNAGDAFTDANGARFLVFVYRINGVSSYHVKALQ